MDQQTKFLCGLIELQYDPEIAPELRLSAEKISWAKGWPEKDDSFWNAEAFMWENKINKSTREIIFLELKKQLAGLDGRNLDLGCGAYSYVPSVGVDFSAKMLQFNENCQEKINADLEKELPLKEESFDSATMVFSLNYIQNYQLLLSEIRRALKSGGKLVIVLSANEINGWQRQKEKNRFSKPELTKILEQKGFLVNAYKRDNLLFFVCIKKIVCIKKKEEKKLKT